MTHRERCKGNVASYWRELGEAIGTGDRLTARLKALWLVFWIKAEEAAAEREQETTTP